METAARWLRAGCRIMESLIAKRADSPYGQRQLPGLAEVKCGPGAGTGGGGAAAAAGSRPSWRAARATGREQWPGSAGKVGRAGPGDPGRTWSSCREAPGALVPTSWTPARMPESRTSAWVGPRRGPGRLQMEPATAVCVARGFSAFARTRPLRWCVSDELECVGASETESRSPPDEACSPRRTSPTGAGDSCPAGRLGGAGGARGHCARRSVVSARSRPSRLLHEGDPGWLTPVDRTRDAEGQWPAKPWPRRPPGALVGRRGPSRGCPGRRAGWHDRLIIDLDPRPGSRLPAISAAGRAGARLVQVSEDDAARDGHQLARDSRRLSAPTRWLHQGRTARADARRGNGGGGAPSD